MRRKKIREEKESEERKSRGNREALCFPMFWKHCVFQCFGSGEPSGQMRDEKLHAVVAQSTFRSQERVFKN